MKPGGGSIMLCGGFSAEGPGRQIEGYIDAVNYRGNVQLEIYIGMALKQPCECPGLAKSVSRTLSNPEFVPGFNNCCSLYV